MQALRFWICPNKLFWLWKGNEYDWSKFHRVLNMLPRLNIEAERDRRVQGTVIHLRWSVLQKIIMPESWRASKYFQGWLSGSICINYSKYPELSLKMFEKTVLCQCSECTWSYVFHFLLKMPGVLNMTDFCNGTVLYKG